MNLLSDGIYAQATSQNTLATTQQPHGIHPKHPSDALATRQNIWTTTQQLPSNHIKSLENHIAMHSLAKPIATSQNTLVMP